MIKEERIDGCMTTQRQRDGNEHEGTYNQFFARRATTKPEANAQQRNGSQIIAYKKCRLASKKKPGANGNIQINLFIKKEQVQKAQGVEGPVKRFLGMHRMLSTRLQEQFCG